MKVVIDIDENIYHRFVAGFVNEDDANLIERLFKNGVPLQEEQGEIERYIFYLENIINMFERGKENCTGAALEFQQKHIYALQYAIKAMSWEVK